MNKIIEGLTIEDKNIEMGMDLNKYGKKIAVKKGEDNDENEEESPLTLRETFIASIGSIIAFFVVFFLSSVIIKLILFKYVPTDQYDPNDQEKYENDFLPQSKDKLPYSDNNSDNNSDPTNNFFRKNVFFYYPNQHNGNDGIGGNDSNDGKEIETHGPINTIKNLYVETIYCFRIFLNFIFGFIFNKISNENLDNYGYTIRGGWNYLFTLIVIPLLFYLSPIIGFPLTTLFSFIGVFNAYKNKVTNSQVFTSKWLGGIIYFLIYFFVLFPIFTVPLSFLLILNLICVILYSLINNLKRDIKFSNGKHFSILNNFSKYFPHNLFLALLIFVGPFIPKLIYGKFKSSSNGTLNNIAVILSICIISFITFIFSFAIKKWFKLTSIKIDKPNH